MGEARRKEGVAAAADARRGRMQEGIEVNGREGNVQRLNGGAGKDGEEEKWRKEAIKR